MQAVKGGNDTTTKTARREQAGKSDRYQAIGNLKAAAKMLNCLQQNQISKIKLEIWRDLMKNSAL